MTRLQRNGIAFSIALAGIGAFGLLTSEKEAQAYCYSGGSFGSCPDCEQQCTTAPSGDEGCTPVCGPGLAECQTYTSGCYSD